MDIIYEKKGRIVTITINRPDAMNALGGTVPQDMREAFIEFRDNPDLWVAIITGAGDKAFCAGADIKGLIGKLMKEKPAEDRDRQLKNASRRIQFISHLLPPSTDIAWGVGWSWP